MALQPAQPSPRSSRSPTTAPSRPRPARLHVTPSAVSQRIRALECEVGPGRRAAGRHAVPADRGRAALRPARPADPAARRRGQDALVDDTRPRVDLPVAVNADSLATWFRDVLAERGPAGTTSRSGCVVEDQAYSAGLLRSGDALAAVTSDPAPGAGLRGPSTLGFLRYRPAATPELRRALAARAAVTDWAADAGRGLQRARTRSSTTCSAARGVTEPADGPPGPDRRRLPRGGAPAASAGGCCPSRSCCPTSRPAGVVTPRRPHAPRRPPALAALAPRLRRPRAAHRRRHAARAVATCAAWRVVA